MATKTGAKTAVHIGTAILEQLAELDAKSISPETARKLLDIRFASPHKRRLNALSEKARDGTLTPAARAELDDFIRVADLLAILHSRARQALKNPGLPV